MNGRPPLISEAEYRTSLAAAFGEGLAAISQMPYADRVAAGNRLL